jgi:16S rRNA (cytosine967-C5)-methyltransferase
MRRYQSYIQNALVILQTYTGDMPFAIYARQFFARDKKFGSKDRKQIAAICYSYFRMAHALQHLKSYESLIAAHFLCSNQPSPIVATLQPEWTPLAAATLHQKLQVINVSFNEQLIFPFLTEVHPSLDIDLFKQSFFRQPALFLRIRPGYEKKVTETLQQNNIAFSIHNKTCVQLEPATNTADLFVLNKEVVIQDYNSQRVLDMLPQFLKNNTEQPIKVWDCCAASGGKSILAKDLLPGNVTLSVSDVRPSILQNLQQRFKQAGINNYQQFTANLLKPVQIPGAQKFDIIICDAPCSGSGTWGRTPEELCYFNPSAIDEFASLQKNIICNSWPHLKKNGLFVYITCAVFKKENQDAVEYIQQQPGAKLLYSSNLYGYTQSADSMFVSIFKQQH